MVTIATSNRPSPISIADFWEIGLQLAHALDQLHSAGRVHRNLNPASFEWNAESRKVTLVDFADAVASTTIALEMTNQAQREDTLAYISPEQTGRTERPVDTRSDLYSLGSTFYELLTGSAPFTGLDSIELIHAHLARAPIPPHALNENIPPLLSDLVLKLLEKEPERRYQTAAALKADLQNAARQWQATGTVIHFPLGEHDVPRQIAVPEKLYGRSVEFTTLQNAFERVCKGHREFILVTGVPGIGKSALVYQLERIVTVSGGYFIAGKCEQLQRGVPYASLVQALRMLVRRLLTEPESTLVGWRERIQSSVAPNAQILIDVIPEIESILGPQLPVVTLGPVESKNRFHQVFTSFLNLIAARERPFVIFQDDMQWMDSASLDLLQQWMDDRASGHTLVIGAYRDSEVHLADPLALALTSLRKSSLRMEAIRLETLNSEDVAQLIADTFGKDVDSCTSLAGLVTAKTAGNPFFIKRVLHALHAEGLLYFSPALKTWDWDIDQIKKTPVSDNVLDLMAQSIGRLPQSTQRLLQVAACIGNRFEVNTLASVTGTTSTVVLSQLRPALDDNLLQPLRDSQNVSRGFALDDQDVAALPVMMRFVHDRVQQAAYNTVPETQRGELHLDIGRHGYHEATGADLDGRLFDIVDQLNLGATLIDTQYERDTVARLNLVAGRKAKSSSAYHAAYSYLNNGENLLSARTWELQAELSFAIHRELAECAYLTGQHSVAERVLETALAHSPSKVATADLYSLRVLAATVAGDWPGALRWGREGLAVFGQEWPLELLAEANDTEMLAVMENVGSRKIEDFVDAAEVLDEETRACMSLFSILGPPAYFSGSEVLTFLIARSANLSLIHGPSAYSAYAYVFYGCLHNVRTGEYDVGYSFGKLALALARRFGNRAEESRTLEVFSLLVHAWCSPLRDSLPLIKEGHRAGIESGELAYAAFNLCSLLINGLPAGVNLEDLLVDADVSIDFASRHKNQTALDISLPFRQFARCLAGKTSAPTSFDDGNFNTFHFFEAAGGNQTALGQFWVARLQAAYLIGDYETARNSSRESAKSISAGILGMVTSAEHSYYTALTLAAQYTETSEIIQSALLDEIETLRVRLADWAKFCPENFLHKQKLVEAELERVLGSPWRALELYGDAIDGAQKSGFIQDAALANELAARLFDDHGQSALADVYLRAAIKSYRLWGATVKVDALQQVFAGCLAADDVGPGESVRRSFDAFGLIKASQAIAAETVPERLFERILQIVVEVAGAQTGILLLGQASELRVRASITSLERITIELEDTALADCTRLPRSVVRYVARMNTPMVMDDAAIDAQFASDAEVQALGLHSVLCVPLTQQGSVVGCLYLENSAMAGVFTAARVDVVKALAAQATISLENSTLLVQRELAAQELRQLAANLSTENRRKTEFLATLAHELRNPLAPMRTGLDLIRISGNNAAATAKVYSMMDRQLSQMVHLIDDLLDIARINSGKVDLKRELVDLGDAVTDAVEAALPLIEAARHETTISLPATPLSVLADRTRLAQILGNLLTNAAKYTPAGGHIAVSVHQQERWVNIVITDSGIGIAATALPEVFDMFTQVSRNAGRSQGGLGIGLSLVRSLVHMHGGTVTAISAGEGQGSTFTVTLPLQDAIDPDNLLPVRIESEAPRPDSLKILVADDNVDAGKMLMDLLEISGHYVDLVHDGQQALDKALANLYDLAILDIGMPQLNGHEVARAIRKLPERGRPFLAALTGWGTDEDRSLSKEAGFDAHLTKPSGIVELKQLLATVIKSKLDRELTS